ncbi:hypothetical protein ACJX0J_025912, partial [Zea mays]
MVRALQDNAIDAEIVGGHNAGTRVTYVSYVYILILCFVTSMIDIIIFTSFLLFTLHCITIMYTTSNHVCATAACELRDRNGLGEIVPRPRTCDLSFYSVSSIITCVSAVICFALLCSSNQWLFH